MYPVLYPFCVTSVLLDCVYFCTTSLSIVAVSDRNQILLCCIIRTYTAFNNLVPRSSPVDPFLSECRSVTEQGYTVSPRLYCIAKVILYRQGYTVSPRLYCIAKVILYRQGYTVSPRLYCIAKVILYRHGYMIKLSPWLYDQSIAKPLLRAGPTHSSSTYQILTH